MRPFHPLLGASFGLLSCISFLVLYGTAVAIDPGYDFFEDYLSDLGVGPGAWAFNSAVISAGILVALFAVLGIGQLLPRGGLSKAGVSLLAASGILLVSIGVFTEDFGGLHTTVSFAFFVALEAAMATVTFALHRTNALGRTGWSISAIVSLLGIGVGISGTGPASETVAVLLALSWGSTMSSIGIWLVSGHRVP